MSQKSQCILIFVGYAILFLGTVLMMHFGYLDQNTGSLIIGGVLSHIGFSGVPTVIGVNTNGKGTNNP